MSSSPTRQEMIDSIMKSGQAAKLDHSKITSMDNEISREEMIKAIMEDDARKKNSGIMGAVGTGLKALDYDRATTGGPLAAKALDAIYTGAGPAFNQKEMENARNFSAPYPSTSDLLERKGILKDSPWIRGGVGLIGDIAESPSTYLSGGVSALAKAGKGGEFIKNANKIINPLGEYLKSRSSKLYGKAFENLDKAAPEFEGAVMPSKILENEGFVGGSGAAANKLEKVNDLAGQKIGKILNQADNSGVRVNTRYAMMPAIERASALKEIPTEEAHALAAQIEKRVDTAAAKGGGSMKPGEANDLKGFLQNLIKTSGFEAGTDASLTKQGQKAISSSLSQGIPEAVSAYNKPLGAELIAANRRYGATGSDVVNAARSAAENEGIRPNLGLSPSEWGLLGATAAGGAGGSPAVSETAAALFALKKAHQAATSTIGRTARARAGQIIGNSGMATPLLKSGAWSGLRQITPNDEVPQ